MLYLKQMELGPMQNFVYLLGDPVSGEAAVVDPAWEVETILKAANEAGLKITTVLVTHTHHDHVNGLGDLVNRTDAQVFVQKREAGVLKAVLPNVKRIESGEETQIGRFRIQFIHTPGHTPGSQCFYVENRLIAGDTLFIGSCGRCDLPGGNAEEMYWSLTHRLLKLPDSTLLLPGHNYAEQPTSFLAHEKSHNPYLQCQTLEAFLRLRLG
jgi:glyoxylase-like metal-dependent hydrolase (beta-lactamase superfamily II)